MCFCACRDETCSCDAEVFQFIDREARDFNPYRIALTAEEVLHAARHRYGDLRCETVLFWTH